MIKVLKNNNIFKLPVKTDNRKDPVAYIEKAAADKRKEAVLHDMMKLMYAKNMFR